MDRSSWGRAAVMCTTVHIVCTVVHVGCPAGALPGAAEDGRTRGRTSGAGPVSRDTASSPAVDLVALAADGTVLTPDHGIAASTTAAVAAARRRGVRVVLASSRGPAALAAIQDELG